MFVCLVVSADVCLVVYIYMREMHTHIKKYIYIFMHICGHGSTAVRMPDSQSRQPRFESSCCHFETLEILFTPTLPQYK